jgi:hypothetical protein
MKLTTGLSGEFARGRLEAGIKGQGAVLLLR